MNGVVILNEIEAVVSHTWGFSPCGILLIILGIISIGMDIYFGIKNKTKDKNTKLLSKAGVIVALVPILMGTTLFMTGKTITETQYEIYMPGEVNMVEFNERYEIVEQHGLIYTVRDLTNIEIEEEH